MGLLTVGTPLSWTETRTLIKHTNRQGAKQFINQYKKNRDRDNDPLYWGDEVEYMLIKLDPETKTAKVSLNASKILKTLQMQEEKDSNGGKISIWYPEYSAYAIESIPGTPYGELLSHLNDVECNMIQRRDQLKRILGQNHFPVTIPSFPRLGTVNFTEPYHTPTPNDGVYRSMFLPDEMIFPANPRFRAMSMNFAERRTDTLAVNLPVFKDVHTKSTFLDDVSKFEDDKIYVSAAKPQHIYMDSLGFGMGTCTLQVTMQFRNITEAMKMHDNLYPLTPIMVSLSAAAPIHRGYLADTDSSWVLQSLCCDDRSREERGLVPLKYNRSRISKSRMDTLDCYLSACHQIFNDTEIQFDHDVYKDLLAEGVHEPLAKYIANIFLRDPLCLYKERIHQNEDEETEHLQNLLTSNWKPLKFKIPDTGSTIGWGIEFRSMDVQLSDFENAAYVVFIVLVARAIDNYGLSFVIPISKLDENMKTAYQRNAVLNSKFHCRKNIYSELFGHNEAVTCDMASFETKSPDDCIKMTIDQIINGCDEFPGLVPIIHSYIRDLNVDPDTKHTISRYLELVSKRASGELRTNARWMRDFVTNHSNYMHDSVVSEIINFDLMKMCVELQERNDPFMSS